HEQNREWLERLEGAQEQSESADADIEELKAELARNAYRQRELEDRCSSAEEAARGLRAQIQAVQKLERLPESLEDVLNLIEQFHPERIVFTEKARKSAASYRFTDIKEAWRCLWSMATVLYDLHFEQRVNLRELSKVFKETTGFELAICES